MKTHQLFTSTIKSLAGLLFIGTAHAQCPTGVSPIAATINNNDIQLTAVPQPAALPQNYSHTTHWFAVGASGTFTANTTELSPNFGNSHTFTNVPAGTYTVCANYVPTNTACPAYNTCTFVTIASSSVCSSAFSVASATLCNEKQFTNTSTGTIAYYHWDFGDGTTLNVVNNNPFVHQYPNTTGTYQVLLSAYSTSISPTPCNSYTQTVIVSCSGCAVSSSITIFADTANAGNYFCYNQSTGTGTLSYFWDFGDGTSSTQQYPFHQYAAPGNYPVCLTTTSTSGTVTCSDTDCDSSSVQKMAAGFLMSSLNVVPQMVTGIKNIQASISLNIYPNPVGDVLNIELGNANETAYTLTLVDAIGREVIKKGVQGNNISLNTSDLEKGYYSLVLLNNKGEIVTTIKLVK
jgi:PKD repeat protein